MSNPINNTYHPDNGFKIRSSINKTVILAALTTLIFASTRITVQAKGLEDALPYLAIPAGIAILGKTIESVDAAQKAEQAKLQMEEQNRKAEEQRRLAEAERQRKQAEYDRWFTSLTKEQQVQVVQEQERTKRTQQQVQGELFGAGIEAASRVLGGGW